MPARGVARLLHVDTGEGADVGLLLGAFFLLAFGYVTGQAANYALFVERFGARAMPLAILCMPVFGVALTFANVRIGGRFGLARLLLVDVAAMVIVSLAVRVGVAGHGPGWLRFLLPVWDAGVNNLSNLLVWSAASRLFDVRQAKRLSPVVSAGRSSALVVGGLLVPLLVAVFGTHNLYLVQAAAFALAGAVLLVLVRSESTALGGSVGGGETRPEPQAERPVRPYLLTVFATVFLSMMAYVLVRNIFLDRGAAQFPQASRYAAEIGLLNAAQGVLTLVVGLFLAGRFLGRFGLRAGLLALPGALLVVYVPFVVLHLGAGGQFTLAAAGFVVAGAMMFSVRTPSNQLLYQPLDPLVRTRAVSTAEGVVEPAALGAAAVVLLAVTRLVDWGARGMAAAVVAAAAGLLVVGVAAFLRYRSALQAVLSRRWLRGADLDLTDQSTRDVLLAQAGSGDLGQVAAAVGLLEEGGHDAEPLLVELIGHPDAEFRAFALDRLAGPSAADHPSPRPGAVPRATVPAAVPPAVPAAVPPAVPAAVPPAVPAAVPPATLARVVAGDPVAEVRAAAARLAGRAGWFDVAGAALDDREDPVRRAAATVLLQAGDPAAVALARARVGAWARSGQVADRVLAAETVAAAGGPGDVTMVTALLDDPDDKVRAGALSGAGRVGDPALLGAVVDAFAHPMLRVAASEAVAAYGDPAVEALAAALETAADRATARRMVQAAGRIEGPEATSLLTAVLVHPDPALRATAAQSLAARAERLDPDRATTMVQSEVGVGALALAVVAAFEGRAPARGPTDRRPPAEDVLVDSLWDAAREARDQVLRLLTLTHDPAAVGNVARGVATGDVRRRAYALETLDTMLGQPLKAWVLPLAGLDGSASDVLRRLPRAALPGRARDLGPAIAAVAAGPDPWLATVARHFLEPDPGTLVQGGDSVIPIIERVVFLKGVDAFAGLPTETLGDVASLLDQVVLGPGETLFHKGDEGISMYLVVEGRVRIHDGGRPLDERGPRSVFGELALLDAEPRSASVEAVDETVLFRLDQAPFFELMSERPEVLRGMMRSVIGTLRARLADVTDLRAQLDDLRAAFPGPGR